MKVVDKYQLEEVVGAGSYGKVYRSRHIERADYYAVKCIPQEKFRKVRKLNEFTQNEIAVLGRISHPNIVRYVEKLETQNNTYMVYEFCSGGTLEKKIYENGHLAEESALRYFSEIISAVALLERHRIMHRDIKPSNIMLHDERIKIGDFGFCKALGGHDFSQTMVGSPIYMAPEVLRGQTYDAKADVWSLGVMLYEMLFGRCPFEEKTITSLIALIDRQQLRIPRNVAAISQKSEELLRRMLVVDPRRRSTIREIQEQLSSFCPYSLELQRKYNSETGLEARTSGRSLPSSSAPPQRLSTDRGPRPQSEAGAAFAKTPYPDAERPPPSVPAIAPYAAPDAPPKSQAPQPEVEHALARVFAAAAKAEESYFFRELRRIAQKAAPPVQSPMHHLLFAKTRVWLLLHFLSVVWQSEVEAEEEKLLLVLSVVRRVAESNGQMRAAMEGLEGHGLSADGEIFRQTLAQEAEGTDAFCAHFHAGLGGHLQQWGARFPTLHAAFERKECAVAPRALAFLAALRKDSSEPARSAALDAILVDGIVECFGVCMVPLQQYRYIDWLGRLPAEELRALNAAKLAHVNKEQR